MPKTIKMTRDFPVARNGHSVETWRAGTVFEGVDDALADDLIQSAKAAIEVKVSNEVETKVEAKAPARK